MRRRTAVWLYGRVVRGPPAVVTRFAHLRTDRRYVHTTQKLLGLVLAGSVVFRLHLPQRTRLRVSVFLFRQQQCVYSAGARGRVDDVGEHAYGAQK